MHCHLFLLQEPAARVRMYRSSTVDQRSNPQGVVEAQAAGCSCLPNFQASMIGTESSVEAVKDETY